MAEPDKSWGSSRRGATKKGEPGKAKTSQTPVWTPSASPAPSGPKWLSRLSFAGVPAARLILGGTAAALWLVVVAAASTAPRGAGGGLVTTDADPIVAHVTVHAGDGRSYRDICLDNGVSTEICEASQHCAERSSTSALHQIGQPGVVDIYLRLPANGCG